jgi:hypothetical protein
VAAPAGGRRSRALAVSFGCTAKRPTFEQQLYKGPCEGFFCFKDSWGRFTHIEIMAVARFCDKYGKFDIDKMLSMVSFEKAAGKLIQSILYLLTKM